MKLKYKIIILLLYLGVVFINAALAVEEVEYNITVPDYRDIEKNLTISNVVSYTDAQNAAFYQTVFNTDGSITFQNKNNGNIILTSSPQYFLNYCQGTDCFEITNGNISPTIVTNGNLTYITAIEDTNAYVKVTHRYELDAASPYIKYIVTLRYKQNVTVTAERFDFNVHDKGAQVMTRDLKLIPFDNLKTYWSDLYTPKVIKFNNGLSFVASDTMESMKLQTSGIGSLVSFYSDYKENHPHFHYIRNGAGRITYTSESIRSMNDTYSASITFAINPSASPKTLIKTRQPYGYDSALTLTNHADRETPARIKAIAYGTEDETAPDYGTKGIVGRGIGWTKSVFVFGCSPLVDTDDCYQGSDLQDTKYKSITDKLYLEGVEIVGHSITPNTDSRRTVSEGLQTLSQYNTRNWIDHGAGDGSINWEDFASQGAIKGDQNYDLDIFDQYNYKYAWSYIDLPTTTSYSPNMLQPANTEEVRPFFFYNNQVDNNIYDSKKIYLWSTVNTREKPESFYTNSNIDVLISERGVHIGHEYMAYDLLNYHTWYLNNGKIKITPTFDSELAYIAGKKENGLLWSPTMSTLGDYMVSLKDISVIYNSDGTYTITNNGSLSITGITLLAEDTIQSATIDEQSLVSFGGSYGNNELILPTLAGGQSINLKITYGAKDTSIPTITSNDAGKIKVNEITGVWNNEIKLLTMTAEGISGNRSFSVRIPAYVNKVVTVKDTTLGTTIGSYTVSGTGEITFSAPLGSLHTFVITPTSLSPDVPVITKFYPSSSVINIVGDSRTFNITMNQPVNVTWYINGIPVQSTEKGVISAEYTNTSAAQGTWIVNATASNANGSASREWTWTVNTPSASGAPSITGSAPASPLNNIAGVTRSFNITVNQTVNVTWYINGTLVQSNVSVTEAMYTNTSAVAGVWNITAIANNTNGTAFQTWFWTVNGIPLVITIISPGNNILNDTGYVNVEVMLNKTGTAQYLNWNGVNYTMTPNTSQLAGTVFLRNMTGLLSGKYRLAVYANDTTGVSNVSETRVLTVNRIIVDTRIRSFNTTNFIVNKTIEIAAPSGNVTVTIPNGTYASVGGATLTSISIDSLAQVNSTFRANLSSSNTLIGENMSLGPDGAQFSPDIQIRFNYTDAQLTAAGITASSLRVKFYNTTTNIWVEQTPYTLDTTGKYITANVSHFSTFALIGSQTPESTPPSSGGGSGSSSGGGGGGASGENASNIDVSEKYDMQISKDALTSYRFTHAKNPIMFVNITGNTSLGLITTSIEVLKNTSSLVKVLPEGLVYKNVNVWVGTSGFATPKNIKQALIKFRIDNAWMSANGVSAGDVELMKWDGKAWINLETKILSKDDTKSYFEGWTNSFSPFAIVAKTAVAPQPTVITPTPAGTPVITTTATPVPTKKAPGFGIVLALLGLTAVVLRKRS